MNRSARLQVDESRYVHQTVDGEVLIIDTAGGLYFSLRGAGAEIWPSLAAGASREDLLRAAEACYEAPPGQVRDALGDLIERLAGEGILSVGPASDALSDRGADRGADTGADPAAEMGSNGAASLDRRPFAPPIFERYDDMRDLLTLDPIHEVSEEGWPHTRP